MCVSEKALEAHKKAELRMLLFLGRSTNTNKDGYFPSPQIPMLKLFKNHTI